MSSASPESLESVLSSVSLFERLRVDEVARLARHFEQITLAKGKSTTFGETPAALRLVVVVRGRASLLAEEAGHSMRALLDPGDRIGDLSVVTGHTRKITFVADEGDVVLATLDRLTFDSLLAEYPAVALPLASELSSELAVKDDYVRQILELHAEHLQSDELAAAIDDRRAELARRGARVSRLSSRQLFSRLVVRKGAEPTFWMFVGFAAALGGARAVVGLILKYKLEKQLFALVPGTDPNPMHVHHFNYGLILIGSSGLAALFPFGRRGLRALAFVFGAGCGLVFDEFALFWNLNPEYAQGMSLIASAILGVVLLNLIYFRTFWTAIARRTWRLVRGSR